MNRKQFIESTGATCKNWNWSWSFINAAKKVVIFGAWDLHTDGDKSLVLKEAWKIGANGRKANGYEQSREHIRLVEEDGYELFTFPLEYSNAKKDESGVGPAVIGGFIPKLTKRLLLRIGTDWYASDGTPSTSLPQELKTPDTYPEGAKQVITINAYERSAKARAACIAFHGTNCAVCGFNFGAVFGSLGEGFIHVHHVKPIASLRNEYQVDPIADMVPVCPNCHSMIHQTEPPLAVEQLQRHIKEQADR